MERALVLLTLEVEARTAERHDCEVSELLKAREQMLRAELEAVMFEREQSAFAERKKHTAEANELMKHMPIASPIFPTIRVCF